MPEITGLKYGVSKSGVEQYLIDIKSGCLKQAEDLVRNIDGITRVCYDKWEGIACENFLKNLSTDGEHLCKQFDVLYNILEDEVSDLCNAMINKDKQLID